MPKVFAVGASIVLTSVLSLTLFEYHPPTLFWAGVLLVVVATTLFEARAILSAAAATLGGSVRSSPHPSAVGAVMKTKRKGKRVKHSKLRNVEDAEETEFETADEAEPAAEPVTAPLSPQRRQQQREVFDATGEAEI